MNFFMVVGLLIFFILVLLLNIYNHRLWRERPQRTYLPSWKDIKEILTYKQKKKFYDDGYADEPDEDEFEVEKRKVINERLEKEKKL